MVNRQTDTLTHLLLLLIVVTPLFFFGLSNHGLWSADEPRVAEIGREMALTGNWAVPTLNQKPFLEQPPLYYAALAVTFKMLGVSDKVVRLPSALFSFGTVLVLFIVVNSIFGPRVALLSGLILATSSEFFRVAHWVVVDSALTFFVMSAMALFTAAYRSHTNTKKMLYYCLLYVACTLGFFTKGFIGVVIPGLAILTFLLFERNLKELGRMRIWLGVLIFLSMTLPWFLALWDQGGTEHLKVFLLHNHLQRFLPASMAGTVSESASGHHHWFFYYITEFPLGFLPWSLLLIPVLFKAFGPAGRLGGGEGAKKGALLAKCWFFSGIIFLSLASTKRTLYLMPIFPSFALLTALYIDATITKAVTDRIDRYFLWALSVLLIAVAIALVPLYSYLGKAHDLALGAGAMSAVVAFSAVVTGITIVGLWFLHHNSIGRYWTSISSSTILLLLFTLIAVVPMVDKQKSFVSFCQKISALVPPDRPLYTYKPDETLRGVIPFYTGRYVVEVEHIDQLLAYQAPMFIVIRDKRSELEKELVVQGRPYAIERQRMGSDRTLTLFSFPNSIPTGPERTTRVSIDGSEMGGKRGAH